MTGRHLGSAIVAILALTAACNKELDTSKPERAIAREVKRAYGITPKEVSCPDNLKAKKGSKFQCVIVLSDDRLTAEVEQTDDKGGLRFDLAQALISRAKVEAAVKQQYNATKVNCGKRDYWVSRAGRTIRCNAEDAAGGKGTVTVTVTDDRGNLQLDQ
jgi:hypothetical protein